MRWMSLDAVAGDRSNEVRFCGCTPCCLMLFFRESQCACHVCDETAVEHTELGSISHVCRDLEVYVS